MDYYELNLQREREIQNGLLQLMESCAYEQITVTDLAKHLGMSRKCFYNYFSSKEACFESLTGRLIRDCALEISNKSHNTHDYYSLYVRNLEYWKAHRVFLETVIQNELMHVFAKHCIKHIMEEEKRLQADMETAQTAFDEDILQFYVTGQISLLLSWCSRGFDTPVEEMARKTLRLIHMPLIPLSQNEVP